MRPFSFLLSLHLLFCYPQKVSGDAIYSIEYNGHEVFSIENNAAIEKSGMELSLGDNYYLNANSKARNIILEEILDAH